MKGNRACPICGDNISSIGLKYGKKWNTLGIENFYHKIILFVIKKSFNGQRELGSILKPFSEAVVFEKTKDLDFQRENKQKKKTL